jgi:betaine reductase
VTDNPVIRNCAFCLVHAPDLVRYGSKPRRELEADPSLADRLDGALRSYAAAVEYPPNQTFIGNLSPQQLGQIPKPWFTGECTPNSTEPSGSFGEIIHQDLFYAALRHANVLHPPLVALTTAADQKLERLLAAHSVFGPLARGAVSKDSADFQQEIAAGKALPLKTGGALQGLVRGDNRSEGAGDTNLDAHTLLEALTAKTTGALALRWLLHREGMQPDQVDYIISCGEEAAGDRYQRGGGGVAKAIGEMCGCINASGMDVKNFCAAPASALITAGALIKAGLYERVAVVAGGSLSKLGMKSMAFLREGIPILDDSLGCMAFLVTRNDGASPMLRLDRGAVGKANIGASTSDQAIYEQLILQPLRSLGLTMADVDRFAPELHNPEIMEYSGSGDVAHKNYRMIAATAVLAGEIDKAGMSAFTERVGMTGFAPTQGHIPSGVPYVGHALAGMQAGELSRVMFLCKASLFLNRLTGLFDGVSFLLESQKRQP